MTYDNNYDDDCDGDDDDDDDDDVVIDADGKLNADGYKDDYDDVNFD